MNDIHTSAATLSEDLNGITNWAFQWKMIFNPDLSKQAQEVIISRKINKLLHPTILFNNILLSNSLFQKHHGLTLDIKSSLLTIYKTFIRCQLDCADMIYGQAYNSAFYDKLGSVHAWQ